MLAAQLAIAKDAHVIGAASVGHHDTTANLGSSRMRACSIADGGPGITTVFARLDRAVLTRLVELASTRQVRIGCLTITGLESVEDSGRQLCICSATPRKLAVGSRVESAMCSALMDTERAGVLGVTH
jgi:hypothetical protein